jgi:hypothetical protein
MPVVSSFDGPNRIIYLHVDTVDVAWHPVDIYREYRAERRLNEDFRKYNSFMEYVGNEPKGGGKATPRYLLLLEGCKIIPYDAAGVTEAEGEILTDDQSDPFDVSGLVNPVVVKYSPADAEIVFKEIPSPIQDRLDYDGEVLVDPRTSYTGTAHPTGTPAEPVNNMADALILAQAYDIQKFRIRDYVTLTDDFSGYIFTSDAKNGRVTVSQLANVNQCLFERLDLDGDFNGAEIEAIRCIVGSATNVMGEFYACGLSDKVQIAAYGTLTIDSCTSRVPGSGSPEIDMNPGNDTILNGRALSSGILVTNCDTENSVATFEFIAGRIKIDSSCTGGYISVRDSLDIVNNTGGAVIDTFPTVNKAVWNNYPAQLATLQNANSSEIADLVVERLLGTDTFNG